MTTCRRSAVLLTALLLGVGVVARAEPTPEDPAEIAWARVQQVEVPDLGAKAETARRQLEARKAFLAGAGGFEAAFPELAAVDLNDPAVLRGLLYRLDQAQTARMEARHRYPDLGDPERLATLKAARETTLDLQDAAATPLRNVLLGLQAHLAAHPALQTTALDELRAGPRAILAEVRGLPQDAETGAAARAAAATDDLTRLDDLVVALRRTALLGAPPPSPDADLGRVGNPVAAAGAAARLDLLLPFLSGDAAARAREGIRAWWVSGPVREAQAAVAAAEADVAAAGSAPLPDDRTTLESALEARQAAVVEAQAAVDAFGTSAAGAALERRKVAELRLDAAKKLAQASKIRMERLKERERSRVDAQTEAFKAEEAARQAREAVEQARNETEKVILIGHEESARGAQGYWKEVEDVSTQLSTARGESGRRGRLEKLLAQSAEARSDLPILAADPPRPDPDDVYRGLWALIDELYAASGRERIIAARKSADDIYELVDKDQAALEEARARLDALDVAPRPEISTALQKWQDALDNELRAADELVAVAREDRDDVLGLLRRARRQARLLRPWVSSQSTVQERSKLFEHLQMELKAAAPTTWLRIRARAEEILGLPGKVTDFNFWRALIFNSFWVLLVAGGWGVGRSQTDRIAKFILDRIAGWRDTLRPSDLVAAKPALVSWLQATLDLAVGALVVPAIATGLPELATAITLYLFVAEYRFALASFDLLFARQPSVRPALRILRPATHTQARTTLRWLSIWWLSWGALSYVCLELFDLEVIASMVGFVALVALLGIAVRLLHGWEPVFRTTMERRHQEHGVVAYLSQPPRTALLAAPNAVVSALFLATAWVVEILPRLAREGTRLGSLFNMLSRYRLANQPDAAARLADLPEESRAAILAAGGGVVDRTAVVDQIAGEYRKWLEEERRRGMVALVADRGDGGSQALDSFVAAATVPVVRVELRRRLTTRADLLAWLGEVTGTTPAEDADHAVEAISALDTTVFVVDDIHRAFLRVVDGFTALRALLFVMNATCQHHFWVTSIHRPAWHYLSRLGDLVGMEVFTLVAELPPLGEAELRALTLGRTTQAGYTADFKSLVRTSPLGGDPDAELERTISMFYRLLAEASAGNPDVAARLWTRCLSPREDPHQLDVSVQDCLRPTTLGDLAAADLFILAALRIQDTLAEAELTEVTNMSPGRVRSGVKKLHGAGLVARNGDIMRIEAEMLPVVTRTLKRRHFLQWEL